MNRYLTAVPRLPWKVIGAIATIALLVGAISFAHTRRTQEDANQLLANLRSARLGVTEQEAVNRSLADFSKYRTWVQTQGADHATQWEAYTFESPSWRTLGLAPSRHLLVTLTFDKGRLVDRHFLFQQEPRSGITVDQGIKPFGLTNLVQDSSGMSVANITRFNGQVIYSLVETDTVSIKQLDNDWAFNLYCFTSLRSCKDPRQILVTFTREQ